MEMSRRSFRTSLVVCLGVAALAASVWRTGPLRAQALAPAGGRLAAIAQSDMKEFLSYLASDALQGRQVYTEGYGLAAAYVAEHLKTWGLKPMGDAGFFQTVKLRSYRVTRNSSVTVDVNGQSRTFKHGDHVTFAANAGGKQTLTFNGAEFVGYGIFTLAGPQTNNLPFDDYKGRDVRNKLVAWLPGTPSLLVPAPDPAQPAGGRGRGGAVGGNRPNYAVQSAGAAAVLSFAAGPALATPAAATGPAQDALIKAQAALAQASAAVNDAQAAVAQAMAGGRAGAGGGRGGGGGAGGGAGRGQTAAPAPDFTSVQNVDAKTPPLVTADAEFFEFLFSGAPAKFAEVRTKAERGEQIAGFVVPAKITINIDNQYEVISTQMTKNVVGMVEGSDPKLKETYVFFGAHLDHTGYRQSATAGRGGGRGAAAVTATGEPDLINNGADDDGSGSTALLGIAKAFATGPKPKRSVVFVWHAGEESGLLGSRYMADFPVVPLERIQAQLNMDMIGRSQDDKPEYANSVFVVGADRISSDLHNLVVDVNAKQTKPLTLDYELNDPTPPADNRMNNIYGRSDHYSYAVKGIPIAFFFTGLHVDYHQPGDQVEKIDFPKLTRVAQLVYETGFAIANTDRTLERDNRGPRAGKGFSGKIGGR
jgi:peptidase M28-like protein